MITLIFAGCKKFDEIEASKVEIINENIEKGWDYVKINVEYDYPVALEAVTLYLSEKEDMSGSEAYECNVDGNKFSVEVDSLKARVAYYYCYEYDNGYEKEKSNTDSFVEAITNDVTDITTTSAIFNGNITNNIINNNITARGFCWGTTPSLTIDDTYTNDGNDAGTYSSTISNLKENTTYYVRAYATNDFGISYGKEISFTTLELTLPKLVTCNVTDITMHTATCNGGVLSDGNGNITACGICWSTSPMPTINDNNANVNNTIGNFMTQLTNLSENTTYYVRAYATNEKGTAYGEEKSFTTLDKYNGHEYVDLGLPSGLKWATCNVGADKPEDYGDYYAWGKTEPKLPSTSSHSNYIPIDDISGEAQYDVARSKWGSLWRMPKRDEFVELLENTTSEDVIQNGIKGLKLTGPNGNSIFFPYTGYLYDDVEMDGQKGYYWSSTSCDYNDAYSMCVQQSWMLYYSWEPKFFGLSIRPVLE